MREGTRVWISGVPQERQVEGPHHDGLLSALRAALVFRGIEEQDLDDVSLLALSGAAFRFWFRPDWAPCTGYTCEEPPGVVAAQTLGFDYYWREGGDAGRAHFGEPLRLEARVVASAWRELTGELDRGNPVILFGGAPEADWKAGATLVTGYDDARGLVFFVPTADWRPPAPWDEKEEECRLGMAAEGYRARRRPDETNWVGNRYAPGPGCLMGGSSVSFFALRGRRRVPSEREVVVAVLRRAADLSRGRLHGARIGDTLSGLPAMETLAAALEQPGDEVECLGVRRSWRQIAQEWWHAIDTMSSGGFRRAASRFLQRCADGFGGLSAGQRRGLAEGAKAYGDSGTAMEAFQAHFRTFGALEPQEEEARTVARALSSHQSRTRAAGLIREMRHAEERATVAIEGALGEEAGPRA